MLFLLMGCSSNPTTEPVDTEKYTPVQVFISPVKRNGDIVEHSFIRHIEVFEKYYGEEIGIQMTFVTMPKSILAVCYYTPTYMFAPFIQVDPVYWMNAPEAEREMTILHELAHCILGRDHDETEDSKGVPQSLMYPRSFNENEYKKNRDRYLLELFNLVDKPMIPLGIHIHSDHH
jgi:hypothetical protein